MIANDSDRNRAGVDRYNRSYAYAESENLKDWKNHRFILAMDPDAVCRFRKLYDRPMYSERDLLEVAEGIVTLVGSSRDVNGKSWQRNSSRLLDKALDYITVHARDAITVADVCDALGVGYRRLDRLFKRHLGHGPKDSILACRLHGVRAELRSSSRRFCSAS